MGQRGHPTAHRHIGAVQREGHLLCGGGLGGQISGVGKGPARRGSRGDEPLQHPRPLPPAVRRPGGRRPERLQRQDRGGHRRPAHPGPPALWGL